MPLSMASIGTKYTIHNVGGSDKTRHYLQSLGFTQGADVIVVSKTGGNFIVNVRQVRIAIDSRMANKVMLG